MSNFLDNLVVRHLNHARSMQTSAGVFQPRLASRFEPQAATGRSLPETRPFADDMLDVMESTGDDHSWSDRPALSITDRRADTSDQGAVIGNHPPRMVNHDPSISVQSDGPALSITDRRADTSDQGAVIGNRPPRMVNHDPPITVQPVQTSRSAMSAVIQDLHQLDSVPVTSHVQPDRPTPDARPVGSIQQPGGPTVAPPVARLDSNSATPSRPPTSPESIATQPAALPARESSIEEVATDRVIEPERRQTRSDNIRPNVPVIVRTVPTPLVAQRAERHTAAPAIEPITNERAPDPIRAGTTSDNLRAVPQLDNQQTILPATDTRPTTIIVQPETQLAPSSIERASDQAQHPSSGVAAPAPRSVIMPAAAARPLRNMRAEPKADPPAPTINVTIGRIEVRATPAPTPSAPKPRPTPVMDLDEYLRRRATGGG